MPASPSQALLQSLRPKLFRFVHSKIRSLRFSSLDADDVVQEALLVAHLHPEHYSGKSSWSTWVHGIAIHKSLDLLRSRKRENYEDPSPSHFLSTEPEVEQLLDTARVKKLVLHYLEESPDPFKEAYKRIEVLNEDPLAIAQELGITLNHLRVRLFRIRRSLIRKVQQQISLPLSIA